MTISVTCVCGKVLEAEDKHAGRSGKCSNCGARLTLPAAAPKRTTDPEALFAEYRPTIAETPRPASAPTPAVSAPAIEEFAEATDADDEDFFEELPPVAPRPSTRAKPLPVKLPPDAFRRHFFAVWWCHWVLRVLGLIVLVVCAFALLGVLLMTGAILFLSDDADSFAMRFGGATALLAVWTPGFLLAATWGFCLLAAAELLTASSWYFLKHEIGGSGPIGN